MSPIIDIEEIATNLEVREPGVWFAKTAAPISYPEEANAWCYEVEPNSFWFRHRNACIAEVMKQFPPSGAVFDVGGGNGFVSLGIQNAGFHSVLVEPGYQGICNAKKRGLRPLICSTLEQAGFKNNSVPAVGLFDVIEHIEHDEQFFKDLATLLVRDGRLYITTPAYNVLWSSEDEYAGHFRRYTLKSISEKLERAGFRVDFATYIFSFLPLPVFLLRALPSRMGLRKKFSVEQQKKEHAASGGVAVKVVEKPLQSEISLLKKQRAIPIGGSCLIVASARHG